MPTSSMPTSDNCVSIHPYFTVHAGKMEEFRALTERFVARTAPEPACLYYGFSFCGDVVFCREGYIGAEGALAHVANVRDLLGEAATISDITRLEVHGSAAELEKLRQPLAGFNCAWYALENSVKDLRG